MKRKSTAQTRNRVGSLDSHLVLASYLYDRLGVDSLASLREQLHHRGLEGTADTGNTRFLETLLLRSSAAEKAAKLRLYDANIIRHTNALSEVGRREPVTWKYFQWFGLMAVEAYLDEYLSDAEALCQRLNQSLREHNMETQADLPAYSVPDLARLALWMATGAGKTLLMHVNIMQYRHYALLHGRRLPNRTIVLTPNDGLTEQHLVELTSSGLEAARFDKESTTLFRDSDSVDVLDMHKLRDRAGEKTVAVEAFEGDNLVLIDEGHRGASGTEWRTRRDQLASNGFAFEYSATFGQIVGPDHRAELFAEYARCIAFDYSYRNFHADGYGKDYRIFNLDADGSVASRRAYLLGGMLTFLQQKVVYAQAEFKKDYGLADPLLVFVGSSVARTSAKEKTDVVELLDFLSWVVGGGPELTRNLDLLLSGSSELTTSGGSNVFANAFAPLRRHVQAAGESVHAVLMQEVFNGGYGDLTLTYLSGADGEIAMSVGAGKPFGVVNVGDAAGLVRLAGAHGHATRTVAISDSLFEKIDRGDSGLHVLVGARKFVEGWSSWRVSTMGLLNVGRNEGPQVIQLFGRGVRLKGRDFSLMRSRAMPSIEKPPANVELLETLNVFGVRADYLKRFKEYLSKEALPTGDVIEAVVETRNKHPFPDGLKVPGVMGDRSFRRDGAELPLTIESSPRVHVSLDWYPRVSAFSSVDVSVSTALKSMESVPSSILGMLDRRQLFSAMIRHKVERGYHNLVISPMSVESLLNNGSWYTLRIPPSVLELGSLANRGLWQELMTTLMKSYVDRFYKYFQQSWELSRIRVERLEATDPNIVPAWRLTVSADEEDFLQELKAVQEGATEGGVPSAKLFSVDQHLYNPLVFSSMGSVKSTPVALNVGECRFLVDLRKYLASEPEILKDCRVHVLRNLSRGKGFGFIEADNFYPDFLLWVVDPTGLQRLTFVDPKGLRNSGPAHPKVAFGETVIEVERSLADKSLLLSSFIVSLTPLKDLAWAAEWGYEDYANNLNVLFVESSTYIGDLFDRVMSRRLSGFASD